MRISVAVATCGRPSELAKALGEISSQVPQPFELLVVDQMPSAESRALVRAFPNVRYLEQERRGLSASRNLALAEAKGDYLAVTDEDCYPAPGWLAAIGRALSDPDTRPDAVTGPILPPSGPPPPGRFALSSRPSRESRLYEKRCPPWHVGSGANFTARIDLLRTLGGYDERLGSGTDGRAAEDLEIIDRLLSHGARVRYDGEALIHHAWQTRERRRDTRFSYGFGVGALVGLRIAAGDPYWRGLAQSYCGLQGRPLVHDLLRLRYSGVNDRLRSLVGAAAGVRYGLRIGRH